MSLPYVQVIVTLDEESALFEKNYMVNERNYTVDDIYPMQCFKVSWDSRTSSPSGAVASDFDDKEVWIVVGVRA